MGDEFEEFWYSNFKNSLFHTFILCGYHNEKSCDFSCTNLPFCIHFDFKKKKSFRQNRFLEKELKKQVED